MLRPKIAFEMLTEQQTLAANEKRQLCVLIPILQFHFAPLEAVV